MSVKVFRSSDTNAPPCGGWAGALTDVLLACLVNGYGSVFASATITSNGTNVSNNDTVTIDGTVYTFKTALTPAANEVLIGASAAASLVNLAAAINLQGTSGTTYGAATVAPAQAYVSNVTTTVITVKARKGGTGGNSVTVAKSAATLTLSGATLAGGSGSDSTVAAGWTNPFNGVGGQRVFRAASGVQHYYHFDDASPHTTALAREAQFRGSEAATAFQNVTNYFPTVAQLALGSGLAARKSVTVDNTSRAWTVICDDKTVYVFIASGDTAGAYMSFGFGEIYSLKTTADNYRSIVIGRPVVNSGTATAATDSFAVTTAMTSTAPGHYMPRIASGGGTAVAQAKTAGGMAAQDAALGMNGPLAGADPATQAIIVLPLTVCDASVPGLRGRLRGMFSTLQNAGTFGDGDLIVGSGAYTGRSFLIMKALNGGSAGSSAGAYDITGDWEAN